MKLIAWERAYRETDDPDTVITLIQDLIDTGDIEHVNEHCRDIANKLIEAGICTRPTLKVVK